MNGIEYFIHHEDVRRANGLAPRPAPRNLDDLSWRMLGFLGRRPAKKMRPLSMTVVAGEGRRRSFGSGDGVTLTGPPSELLLYLSGRLGTAVVQVAGPPHAVAALEQATTGL